MFRDKRTYWYHANPEKDDQLGNQIHSVEEDSCIRLYDVSSNKTFSFRLNTTTRLQQSWDTPGFERPKHDQSAKTDKAPVVLDKVKALI